MAAAGAVGSGWRPALAGAALLGCGLGPAAAAEAWASTERISDPLSIQDATRSDYTALAPRSGSNLVFARTELGLAAPVGAGRVSVFSRQSLAVRAGAEALAFMRDAVSEGLPPSDRTTPIKLRATGYAGTGVGWAVGLDAAAGAPGHGAPQPGLQLGAGVELLALSRLVWRDADGVAAFDAAAGRYTVRAASQHASDRLDFPFRESFAGHGTGVLLHGALRACGEQLCADLGLRDVGALGWRGLPQQTATLDSDTLGPGADGTLELRPLVQGRNSQGLRWRAADPLWTAGLAWHHGPARQWSVRLKGVASIARLSAGFEQQLGSSRWHLGWRPRERALELGWRSGAWHLQLALDRLGDGAQTQALSVAYRP